MVQYQSGDGLPMDPGDEPLEPDDMSSGHCADADPDAMARCQADTDRETCLSQSQNEADSQQCEDDYARRVQEIDDQKNGQAEPEPVP